MKTPTEPHESAAAATRSSALQRAIIPTCRRLLVLFVAVLGWHGLKEVGWRPVWNLLTELSPLSITILLVINLLLLLLMTARWWLLLRGMGEPVSLLSACGYRAAANSVSYLTPGPHFGGEPLSVYLLHHRHGISLSSATSSVVIDRLLELLATVFVLSLCLIILSFAEHLPAGGGQELLFVIVILSTSTLASAALFSGAKPLSRSLLFIIQHWRKHFSLLCRPADSIIGFIVKGETTAETLLREHRFQFYLANLFSLFQWGGVFVEFWLMSFFLGFSLTVLQVIALVVVARLAFFTPLPAGIGVLETALPWMTATLGFGGSLGLSLCLLIRIRDIFFIFVGLGLAMYYLTCQRKVGIINDKLGKTQNS